MKNSRLVPSPCATPNIMTGNPVAIVTPEEEFQDIDTLADWDMAEMKYKTSIQQ